MNISEHIKHLCRTENLSLIIAISLYPVSEAETMELVKVNYDPHLPVTQACDLHTALRGLLDGDEMLTSL